MNKTRNIILTTAAVTALFISPFYINGLVNMLFPADTTNEVSSTLLSNTERNHYGQVSKPLKRDVSKSVVHADQDNVKISDRASNVVSDILAIQNSNLTQLELTGIELQEEIFFFDEDNHQLLIADSQTGEIIMQTEMSEELLALNLAASFHPEMEIFDETYLDDDVIEARLKDNSDDSIIVDELSGQAQMLIIEQDGYDEFVMVDDTEDFQVTKEIPEIDLQDEKKLQENGS